MQIIHKYFRLLVINLLIILVFVSCEEDTLPEGGVDADFTLFTFSYTSGDIKSATIDRHSKTITANIDDVADLTNISPVFVLSHQATAFVNGVEQISGVSQNDFSKTVEYKVVSGNKQVTSIYRVTISADAGVIIPIDDMIINNTTVLAASEYHVKGDIIVEEGVYFSILPGCRFKLSPTSKIIVKQDAVFLAVGTAQKPIQFLSNADDDPNQAWCGFEFHSPQEVEFDYCNFENAGNGCALMQINEAIIGVQRCSVNNIHNTGFLLDAKSMFRIFDYNVLKNVGENKSEYYPIIFDNINSLININDNNNISTTKGIFVQNSDIQRSLTLYEQQACPYIFANDITCSVDDITFFIREGVEIQMANDKGIYLGDTKVLFEAKGIEGKQIIFSGVDKTNGSWNGIVFKQNILNGSSMHSCQIVYGGNSKHQGSVRCSGTTLSKLSIQNCAFSRTESHCVYIEKLSDVTLKNNIYSTAGKYIDIFRE